MNTSNSYTKEQVSVGFLDVTVLILSIYVLGALFAQTLFELPSKVRLLMDQIDYFVCAVFLAEFCIRFKRAPSKLQFMRWGWIDLISSIPVVDAFRWGRVVRLVRILRVLRGFRSARHLVSVLYRKRSKSLAATTILSAVILIIFSSIAILAFETDEQSNIRTPFDAVWWAVSTMTTVGYGDKVPITVEGKVVAIILMLIGVGLYGVLTGLFARLFLETDMKMENSDIKCVIAELQSLRNEVESLKLELRER